MAVGVLCVMGVGSPVSRGPVPRLLSLNHPGWDKGALLCEGLEALHLSV